MCLKLKILWFNVFVCTAPSLAITDEITRWTNSLDFFLHRRHRSESRLSDTTDRTVRTAASRLDSPVIPETTETQRLLVNGLSD